MPCFGCGLTRAFICILELKFLEAIRYNVLSIPLFIGIMLYSAALCFDIVLGSSHIQKIDRFLSQKPMYGIYFLILLLSAFFNNYIAIYR